MTRERLQLLSEKFLKKLAVKEGIHFSDSVDKLELIELIVEAMQEDKEERDSANNPAMRIKEKKYQILVEEELPEDVEEEPYPLPERYNETKIVAILRDPVWVYAYWNFKNSDVERIQLGVSGEKLYLRVKELIRDSNGSYEIVDFFDIPVTLEDDSWYINLPVAGREYYIELILKGRGDVKVLCESNHIESPRWELPISSNPEINDSGNDMLLVASIYDIGEKLRDKPVPQRIISMLDDKYLKLFD